MTRLTLSHVHVVTAHLTPASGQPRACTQAFIWGRSPVPPQPESPYVAAPWVVPGHYDAATLLGSQEVERIRVPGHAQRHWKGPTAHRSGRKGTTLRTHREG